MASLEDSLSCWIRPASVLPEPTQSPFRRRVEDCHHHMLQSTSALGVSHPLDGLGPEPLGKYCIPSRTGFASFLVRALTLARPSTPTPGTHIAVNPLRSTLLADPLGSPTSRWASLPEHPAYQRPEDPRQCGTDGRCTPRDPPKRTYRRERSCHVAFPDARAPYEERHSPPAALCHHSAWPSCRFEHPTCRCRPPAMPARLQGFAPRGRPDRGLTLP